MPPAENSGSFWPRTRLFIRSMAVTPVSMKSSRQIALGRIDRHAVDAHALARRHRRTAVGRFADTVKDAAKQAGPNREMQRLAGKAHAHVA